MISRVKKYLSLSKKEWNGMVVLIVLMAIILAAPYVYQLIHKDPIVNARDFDKAVALLNHSAEDTTKSIGEATSADLFDFNPNNLPAEKWKQLGLTDQEVSIIKSYEAKGGHFYHKEDLKKIYGISDTDYKRLEPYIDIPEGQYAEHKLKIGETVEVNSADSATLTKVRGIGPAFAMSIIRYRDRLGGFIRKEQLKEVFDVDSVKYNEIKDQLTINPNTITRVKINSVSFPTLRQFPYLNYKQASVIIEYRTQHGSYRSMGALQNTLILTPQDIKKIEPYISFK